MLKGNVAYNMLSYQRQSAFETQNNS